jgi:hypothetical protein
MLSVKVRRVFLARHRVDFRKRFDGLLAEARQLGADPYDGDCVMFVKRDHTQLRAIVGDSVGLYLFGRNADNVSAVRGVDGRELWQHIRGLAHDMTESWSRETKLGEGARYITRNYDKLTRPAPSSRPSPRSGRCTTPTRTPVATASDRFT